MQIRAAQPLTHVAWAFPRKRFVFPPIRSRIFDRSFLYLVCDIGDSVQTAVLLSVIWGTCWCRHPKRNVYLFFSLSPMYCNISHSIGNIGKPLNNQWYPTCRKLRVNRRQKSKKRNWVVTMQDTIMHFGIRISSKIRISNSTSTLRLWGTDRYEGKPQYTGPDTCDQVSKTCKRQKRFLGDLVCILYSRVFSQEKNFCMMHYMNNGFHCLTTAKTATIMLAIALLAYETMSLSAHYVWK